MWCPLGAINSCRMSNRNRQRKPQCKQKQPVFVSTTTFPGFQWNACGLTPAKVTELLKEVDKHNVDVFIINEANISEQNEKYIHTPGFNQHILYKSRQIASGIFVGTRNNIRSVFSIVKEMNPHDTAEIVEINIWKDKYHTKIYGV